MPFQMKSQIPVKWIVKLNTISNEVAFSCESILVSNEVTVFYEVAFKTNGPKCGRNRLKL